MAYCAEPSLVMTGKIRENSHGGIFFWHLAGANRDRQSLVNSVNQVLDGSDHTQCHG